MATLEVQTDSHGKQYFELTGEQSLLGREPFCDIVIPSHTVSRQHARITRIDEQYYVEDLSSLNGTFVNGKRVDARTPLKDQDRIHIYEILTIFHADAVAPRSAVSDEALSTDDTLHGDPLEDAPGMTLTETHVQSAESPDDTGAQARFRAALKITQNIGESLDLDVMLPKILDSLFDIFPQANRGYILLAEEPEGHLVPRAIKHRRVDPGHSMTFGPISRKTVTRVMADGEAVLMDDSQDQSQSVFDFKSVSMICAPLMGPARQPLGIVYVDTEDPLERFSADDLEVLTTVATVAGQAVDYAGEHAAGALRRRRDLGTAKQVQLHFLPQERPIAPGYEFYDYYQAADEVGGDYFGYIPLPDGRLALAIGDVAGKGVAAALLMAQLCSEVRYCLTTSPTPAAAVGRLNQNLSAENLNYRFITFVLCVLDPKLHTLTVVNAGHMPPLRRNGANGEVEDLGAGEGGLPLGCDPQRGYRQSEVNLVPGDLVLLYTDGISEAMNVQGDMYGVEAMRRLIASGPAKLEPLAQALLEDVKRFGQGSLQSDDICLVGFSRLQSKTQT